MDKDKVSKGKVCAILSYLVIGIIWYFLDKKMKKNKFANYHVKQGIVFLIFDVALWTVIAIIGGIFGAIFALSRFGGVGPNIGLGFFGIISALLSLIAWAILLILLIFGIVNAAQGKKKELPLIGKFGKKFKF